MLGISRVCKDRMFRNPDPVKAMPHFLGKLIGTCGSCGSREIVPIDFPTGSGFLNLLSLNHPPDAAGLAPVTGFPPRAPASENGRARWLGYLLPTSH